MSFATVDVLESVEDERRRQDDKWGLQNHDDGTPMGDGVPIGAKLPQVNLADALKRVERARAWTEYKFGRGEGAWSYILDEEVAEALAATSSEELEAELIQVAAVAVAWVESIRRARG